MIDKGEIYQTDKDARTSHIETVLRNRVEREFPNYVVHRALIMENHAYLTISDIDAIDCMNTACRLNLRMRYIVIAFKIHRIDNKLAFEVI